MIKKVIAKEIKGGFSYFGITDSGEETQLRKKATRLYENAFLYDFPVGVGNGIAGYFLYGKNARYDSPEKTFKVELV